MARKRCWNKDWVLDLDVGAFFDSVGHDLLMKAVAHHTDERWVLLFIERWLKAPMTMRDGTTAPRERGRCHRSDRTRRRREPRQRSHLVDQHPANMLCPPTRPTHRTARHAVEVSTRTVPVAGHALTALSWWPSTGPDHGSEAEMPRSGP